MDTSFVVVLLAFLTLVRSWSPADMLGMPGELRFANEGLTNDGEHMYLNSKGTLWKCSIDFGTKELQIVKKNTDFIPKELRDQGYNHVGDIDYYNGVIYAGVEWSSTSPGVLAAYDAQSLEMLNYTVTAQEGMPWVAAHDGKLYSTKWNEKDFINIYSMDDFSLLGKVKATQGQGLPEEIQGGAFWEDDPGHLYLASNGPYVSRFSLGTGDVEQVLVDKAGKFGLHKYEMEGITFLDLQETGLGTMHIYGNFETLSMKTIHNFSE